MTNTTLLEERIRESGLKKTYLAEQLGLSYQGLYLKIIGKNEFTASEIQKLSDLLDIKSQRDIKAIFFSG